MRDLRSFTNALIGVVIASAVIASAELVITESI